MFMGTDLAVSQSYLLPRRATRPTSWRPSLRAGTRTQWKRTYVT
jgi:hypothetical protein